MGKGQLNKLKYIESRGKLNCQLSWINCLFVNKIVFVLSAIMLFTSLNLNSQTIHGIAGKYGNFIYCGRILPKDGSEILLYRNNESISKLTFPSNATEFVSRVNQFYLYNNYYPAVQDSLLMSYWQWATSFSYIDSLPVVMKQPDILYGLGVLYFDPLNKENERQTVTYGVQQIGRSKQELRIAQPAQPKSATISQFKIYNKEKHIGVDWFAKDINNVLTIRTMKQHFGQDELHGFPGLAYVLNYKDTTIIRMVDSAVKNGLTYRYCIQITDQLGFEYLHADTVKVTHKPINTLPVIFKTKTQSLDAKQAIAITWKLQHKDMVQSIDIFRSLYFDSAFELLTTVVPTDSLYLDYAVKPVTAYWYKLVINSVFERGLNSSKVTGILKIDAKPEVVSQLKCSAEKKGIRIFWTPPTSELHGFYIYRAEGYKGELKQISDLILADPNKLVYEYLDSSSDINTGNPVSYSIKVLSNGYVLSDLSERVSAIYSKPENILGVSNLRTQVEGKSILIVWDNASASFSQIAGYSIYRKRENESDFGLLKTFSNEFNQFLDTSIEIGFNYVYKVVALSYANLEISNAIVQGGILAPTVLAPQIISAIWENAVVKLTLSTTRQEGIKEIEIHRIEEGKNSLKIGSISPEIQTFADKTAIKGKVYFYYTLVKAYGKESQPCEAVRVVE